MRKASHLPPHDYNSESRTPKLLMVQNSYLPRFPLCLKQLRHVAFETYSTSSDYKSFYQSSSTVEQLMLQTSGPLNTLRSSWERKIDGFLGEERIIYLKISRTTSKYGPPTNCTTLSQYLDLTVSNYLQDGHRPNINQDIITLDEQPRPLAHPIMRFRSRTHTSRKPSSSIFLDL